MPKGPTLLEIATAFATGAAKEKSPDSKLNIRRDHFLAVLAAAEALPASSSLSEAIDAAKEVSVAASVVEIESGVLLDLCDPLVAALEAKAKAPAPVPAE